MVKRTKSNWEKTLMSNGWFTFGLALVFMLIAYGFASLAINSGSLWQYALAIVFIVWALKEIARSVKVLIHR